ncbi:glycoside hydrolase [Candidatus Syntrophocurvum alkaliphilum]|uniref:Glycoside hydrolase n=1 Tax=Candidatus Syntrophocurvum alkaliphilum TaxID=2293317 RepID=A0A6I6DP61_9FIRM|nr:putative glycoside hydrolase [Candidatus Syntrophocurvum alkaliphilum]QGU00668.1 glycoside hydrolase [Candidatus Syntrophocurvum alkaliphilum]
MQKSKLIWGSVILGVLLIVTILYSQGIFNSLMSKEPNKDGTPVFKDIDKEDIDWEEIAAEVGANELGTVPILVYHLIGEQEGRWTRTPESFRNDLQELYDRDYVLVPMNDYLNGEIDIPQGKSPAIITFDDSTTGHFRLLEEDGELVVDPDSAVGILKEFGKKHPDFGHVATFYINGYPFSSEPDQRQYWKKKLQMLDEWGFEIGNHTFTHSNLGSLSPEEVQAEIATLKGHVREAIPDYEINSFAIVQDGVPDPYETIIKGEHNGVSYEHAGVVKWAWRDAFSPFHKDFDPYAIERIQVFDDDGTSSLTTWLDRIEYRRYISDGNNEMISFPEEWADYLGNDFDKDIYIYEKADLPRTPEKEEQALEAKGMHVTYYAASSQDRWNNYLNLVEETSMNTVQLDLKDESGYMGHTSTVELAQEIRASKNFLPVEELVADLQERGIYSIARIVVFRDPVLASQRPEYMVTRKDGAPLDNGVWVTPRSKDVWDYNIELAKEAYEMGFDEVQFDYIRFPEGNAAWEAEYGSEITGTRVEVITDFLAYARAELGWDKRLSAAVFGFISFAEDDLKIGQRAEKMGPYLDYMSPMVYPSHYGPGNYGFNNPNAHPYEVIEKSMIEFQELLELTGCELRPWLQAFTMGQPRYGRDEIRAQIEATENQGIDSWLLWHAGSTYHKEQIVP